MTATRVALSVTLALSVLALLAGCATPPSEDDVKALDYGACPRNYTEKVNASFQGTLITRYSGDPVIWPPQQFWYKTPPLEGGRLLAGYLVPAAANQSFGPQMTAGTQLYGFLFKDEELIYKLSPLQMQQLAIKEAVGPFPKDERNWQEGHKTRNSRQMLLEYVLAGETVKNWSELVSVQTVFDVRPEISAQDFVDHIMRTHKSKKPGCATISHRVLAATQTDVLYEQTLAGCAPFRDEFSVRKVIRGPRTLTEASYSKTSPLTDAEKSKWAQIVARTTLMEECAARP